MTRPSRGLLFVFVLALVSALTLSGLDTDAKKNRHRQGKGRPDTVQIKSGTVPWRGEQTVTVHDYTAVSRWHGSIERMVDELNALTKYMPYAPEWVYVDESGMSCENMDSGQKSGINVCVTNAAINDSWWPRFEPPGCPGCASAFPEPVRVHNLDDGWKGHIYLEDTDAGDLIPGVNCGANPCAAAWRPGGEGFNLVSHEFGHAVFGIPDDTPGSTVEGIHPWGPTDFDKAEQWFGQSKRQTINGLVDWEFCDIYPNGWEC